MFLRENALTRITEKINLTDLKLVNLQFPQLTSVENNLVPYNAKWFEKISKPSFTQGRRINQYIYFCGSRLPLRWLKPGSTLWRDNTLSHNNNARLPYETTIVSKQDAIVIVTWWVALATEKPSKDTRYLGFSCSCLKTNSVTPIFFFLCTTTHMCGRLLLLRKYRVVPTQFL